LEAKSLLSMSIRELLMSKPAALSAIQENVLENVPLPDQGT
jgi:hypothetical protein